MEAERMIKTVNAQGFVQLELPAFSEQQVEIIIMAIDTMQQNESFALAQLQEQSGFAQTVLADAVEDVWNEL
jgi:hypothetical protein